MKKLLIIVLLTGICASASYAQTLLQGEKTWYNIKRSLIPPYLTVTVINLLGADTLINGLTYRELLSATDSTLTQFTTYRFLRETADGKVYCRMPGPATDPEYLSYDFSAHLGDTIAYHPMSQPSVELEFVVTTEDSAFIGGRYWKQISRVFETWTEGMGSSGGLINNGLMGNLNDLMSSGAS